MMWLAGLFAAIRTPAVTGKLLGVVLVVTIVAVAILVIRSDIYRAAGTAARETLNKEGVSDADAAEAGRLDARGCHESGRVWNLAKGKCDGKSSLSFAP